MLAPNQPSLSGFALFCASKPRDEAYNWIDTSKCAKAQYFKSIGLRYTTEWSLHDQSESLAYANGDRSSWTFGALHDRLIEAINA